MKKRKPSLDFALRSARGWAAWVPRLRSLGRFLFRSQLLTIFLGLTVLGVWVGIEARPRADAVPWGELFEGMSVTSFRESPADTALRFVVDLTAGGRPFARYDLDSRTFGPPPRGREYRRAITGTHYRPLRVRGHVAHGFWLEVSNASRRRLLPEQFDELYRSTLDFVKPVSLISGALGIASGYSVGYRLGTWNGSLSSRAVQERVIATPGLGDSLAREAWRRVLLEPAVMADESDAARVAALVATQRLYAAFFRTALGDSDAFVPREAARLERAGRAGEARAMIAFAQSARRAADPRAALASADLAAVERWASLLDRYGHWAQGSIPDSGEARVQVLGTLAWYGLAPPAADPRRIWIGPRLLVRDGETQGFITDDLTATGVGCPIAWRERLDDEHTGLRATADAWLADRPEFLALGALGQRLSARAARAGSAVARWVSARGVRTAVRPAAPPPARPAGFTAPGPAPPSTPADSLIGRSFPALGEEGRLLLLGADSAAAEPLSGAARAVFARADSLLAGAGGGSAPEGDWNGVLRRMGAEHVEHDSAGRPRAIFGGVALELREFTAGHALDRAADTLRALGVRGALLEIAGGTVALGASPPGDRWRVALRDPRGAAAAVGWIRIRSNEAASSGTGRTGGAAIAALVIASSAMHAQAWRAELLAESCADARRLAREREGLSAVLIERGDERGDVLWVESDLRERFVLEPALSARYRIEYF